MLESLLVLILALLPAPQCQTPAPGPGWVCQDGGWLPPGHPLIRPTTPAPNPIITGSLSRNPFRAPLTYPAPKIATEAVLMTEAQVQEAASTGTPLPSKYIYFHPPLRLRDIAQLRGTAGRTILFPLSKAAGPLVIIEATSNHMVRQVVRDLMIQCASAVQTGLVINAQNMTLERLTIFGCEEGINFGFSLNSALRDSLIHSNRVGVYAMGAGLIGGPIGLHTITTLRISGCRITKNTDAAIKVGQATGMVIDDSTIIESNRVGLLIAPSFPGASISVLLRDVWWEANGQNISDPHGVVRIEGFRGVH